MSLNSYLALFVAACCVLMLVRLALKPSRRARLDRFAWREWARARALADQVWHWRRRRAKAAQAAQVANDVIERARGGRKAPLDVDKDGNVSTPKSFKGPRKPH